MENVRNFSRSRSVDQKSGKFPMKRRLGCGSFLTSGPAAHARHASCGVRPVIKGRLI